MSDYNAPHCLLARIDRPKKSAPPVAHFSRRATKEKDAASGCQSAGVG
jgi:hypothetical protein